MVTLTLPARPGRLLQEQRQSEVGQAPAPRTAELGALWGLVVERELFQSSHERKYLGFTLFGILLPHLRWVLCGGTGGAGGKGSG